MNGWGQTFLGRRAGGPVAVALLLTCGLVTTGRAGAGTLDLWLLANSRQVLQFAQNRNWKTVGVLPFQVKRGNRTYSYTAAPLCHDMTRRLENALIMALDVDAPTRVGILRDAVGTANKNGVGAIRTDRAAFDLLFATNYDLAWNDVGKPVRADAFLTGEVSNDGNRKRTTVVIQAFDRHCFRNNRLAAYEVARFSVPTDRLLAADLGYNFALKSNLVRSRDVTIGQRDNAILEEIRLEDEEQRPGRPGQPGQPQQGQGHSPTDTAGIRFELRYDDRLQRIKPVAGTQQGSLATEYQVPTAPAKAKITMTLTRVASDPRTLGAVLMVNGRSTWKMQDMEPIRCQKWIYDHTRTDKPDPFTGFYTALTGENLQPFKSLTAEESAVRAAELGNRAGWIDLYVFASGAENQGDESQMLISMRGVAGTSNLSRREVQDRLREANHVDVARIKKLQALANTLAKTRDVIDYSQFTVEGERITEGELPNPVLIGHLAIRYWDGGKGQPSTGQPGGLPQDNP
ncbi:MAG: hypothetical protein U0736_28195 [Gemmataceae bacterium]